MKIEKLSIEEKRKRQEEIRQKRYDDTHKNIDGIVYKFCNKHKEIFPEESEWIPCNEEHFYKNKTNKTDGFHTWCKRCSVKKSVKWVNENYEQFQQQRKNGYFQTEKFKEWKIQHSINSRPYNKRYIQSHPEKTKQYSENRKHKNHNINKIEWESCKQYFDNKCAYCGISIDEHFKRYNGELKHQDFHKEHLNDEGANDLSNCIPSCNNCNSQKWSYKFEEWYNVNNPVFNIERLNKIHKWISQDYKQFYIEKPKLPYKIVRKQNEDKKTYHYELWSLDENEEFLELLATGDKKKDITVYIENLYLTVQ